MNFHSYVSLPEGKPPFSYGFPMVIPRPWHTWRRVSHINDLLREELGWRWGDATGTLVPDSHDIWDSKNPYPKEEPEDYIIYIYIVYNIYIYIVNHFYIYISIYLYI